MADTGWIAPDRTRPTRHVRAFSVRDSMHEYPGLWVHVVPAAGPLSRQRREGSFDDRALTRYGRSANCSCCMRPDAYWQICWLMGVLESLRRPAAEGDMHRRY